MSEETNLLATVAVEGGCLWERVVSGQEQLPSSEDEEQEVIVPRPPPTHTIAGPGFVSTQVECDQVMQAYSALHLGPCKLARTFVRRMSANGSLGPFIIGVAGGTASGKTTVCRNIMNQLGQADIHERERKVVCIAQDSFYRLLSPTENQRAAEGRFNFDHPDALDIDLMLTTVKNLIQGNRTNVPVYDFVSNSRKEDEVTVVYPADVILIEGILAFYFESMRSLFDLKVFVDSDADIRLARRVLRDVTERGRDLEHILSQYTDTVKPAFEEFCLPTKKYADVIIPRGAENTVGINLIIQHIQDLLKNGEVGEVVTNGHIRNVGLRAIQSGPEDGALVNAYGHQANGHGYQPNGRGYQPTGHGHINGFGNGLLAQNDNFNLPQRKRRHRSERSTPH